MCVVMVTVRLPVISTHDFGLVRAFFIPHVGNAGGRIHSQDGGCGDRAS
jgi:hypothetical protein